MKALHKIANNGRLSIDCKSSDQYSTLHTVINLLLKYALEHNYLRQISSFVEAAGFEPL